MTRLVAAALTLCACLGMVAALTSFGARAPSVGRAAPGGPVRFDAAVGSSRRLGPLAGDTGLRVVLALADRHGAALDRLIASGRSVSRAAFAARFVPPANVARGVVRQLKGDGLRVQWAPGSQVVEASGPAAAVEGAFGVRIDRYRASGGRSFYAPLGPVRLRGALRGVVATVAGLDDYGTLENLGGGAGDPSGCGQTAGGYTPSRVLSGYNFGPLLHSGLDGAGETIVLIEINTFNQSDLACFAQQFGERPFNVTVAPEHWGFPDNGDHTEPDLDLEIVHSIAPAAHVVVYDADSAPSDIAAAAQAAANEYPKAILSVSIGGCEWESVDQQGNPVISPDEMVWDNALKQLAATGGTALIASGDAGAYTCGSKVTNSATGSEAPTVSEPASDPYATAVGGTTLFLSQNSGYAGEAAWGGPFEGDGSGGGVSALWKRPAWQSGPGVDNQYSDGYRQVPDVSALGDPSTGWNVFANGSWTIVAGTSSAAPMWAGLIALADQSLRNYNLAPVGFANLPLYSFGQDPGKQPAPPFHEITRGNNLYYPATAGWNYATGWGSPNAAGVVDDFLAYREGRK